MIDVNYTCSVCKTPLAPVEDALGETTLVWGCEHRDVVIHANMSGRVFGEGALAHGTVGDDEIPAAHREAFFEQMKDRSITYGDGRREWFIRDWMEYINAWHAAKKAAREARAAQVLEMFRQAADRKAPPAEVI